ncbi:MAG: metalloregulator ArsR/SmtB family transcription factor [Rickettsiales bacterium]|nr:metalloregulator ArsR/SmtB family transcription factor [Rickettsiales bacterium]
MTRFVHPSTNDIMLPNVLSALADPVRLDIVRKLHKAKDGLCCSDAAPCHTLPKSTLSNHFRVLRESGLIRTEKCGLEHISRLRKDDINQKFPGLLKLVLALSDKA